MPRILLTHSEAMFRGYYGDAALAALQAVGTVLRNPHPDRSLATSELIERARGCRIIVSDRQTPGEAAVFRALPDLVAFVRCAVDIRNVDVAAASAAGVLVTRASPGFVPAVSEWILGAMVALARRLPEAVASYRAGHQPAAEMGVQLAGATAGVIGYGAIGRHVVDILQAVGMRVLVADPHVAVPPEAGAEQVELAVLLARADFVICLAVATEATENLIDAAALARMKPTAFLVNASRGNLIDETALLAALSERRIAGAALDVGRAPDQMPSPALARLPNVVATPHIGGLTPEAVQHQAMETTRQVAAVARGEAPPGAVNAEAAHRLAPEELREEDMAETPRKPTIEVPPGACDTHMHVYYAGHPAAPTAAAPPPDGPPDAYRDVQRRLGLERVVVVQPSAYGFDNEPTLRAMRDLAPGTRGVAVVGPQTSEAELDRLTKAGIRGARFFMLPGGALPWEQLAATAARVQDFGWHVQLQMDGRLLHERLALVRGFPGQVVIDHNGKFLEPVGRDHPGMQALYALLDTGRVWIKCSAPYETSKTGHPKFADVSAIARGLIAHAPERMLWATNWPHPGQPKDGRTDEAMLLDLLADWAPDAGVRKRILVDNPAALYGF